MLLLLVVTVAGSPDVRLLPSTIVLVKTLAVIAAVRTSAVASAPAQAVVVVVTVAIVVKLILVVVGVLVIDGDAHRVPGEPVLLVEVAAVNTTRY